MLINLVIIAFFVIQHFSSVLLLKENTSFKKIFLAIGFISYLAIYMLKSPSYDLLIYIDAFGYAATFEPGYYLLSVFLKGIGLSNEIALLIIRLLLAFLFIYPPLKIVSDGKGKQDKLVLALIVISSVGFILGVNNVIRQGYASVLVMLSFMSFIDSQKLLGAVLAVLAISFHYSAVFFLTYSLIIYYLAKSLYEGKIGRLRTVQVSAGVSNVAFFLIPILAAGAMMFVMQFVYTEYLELNMIDEGSGRTTAIIKTSLVFVVYLCSEWSFGNYDNRVTKFVGTRFLRLALIALVFWLSIDPMLNELAARILYFYFVIEIFVLLYAYKRGKVLGVVITLLSYGFAFNAINILTGGN